MPAPVTRDPELDGISCSCKEIKFKEDTVTIVFNTSDSTQFVPFVVLQGSSLMLNVREAQGRFKFAEETEKETGGTASLPFEEQQSIDEQRDGLIAEIRELEEKIEVAEPIEFTGNESLEGLAATRDTLSEAAAPAPAEA